jgi:hypothetical protein
MRWGGLLALVLVAGSGMAQAGDELDLDLWHQQLADEIGEDPQDGEPRIPAIGFYPAIGAALGPPNWVSAQGSAYLSYTDGKNFSLFVGYGIENGPRAEARVVTLGWGGVQPLHVASKQLGFHGKFLRYRRWVHDDHGVHHGLSLGTESGVGYLSLGFEVGAARSSQNHWIITAEVALKLTLPVRIPLKRTAAVPKETTP